MIPDDPLADLRDIQLPADPSWWPPAIGWWLVAGLLALFIVAAIWLIRRHRVKTAPRRHALSLLEKIEAIAVDKDHVQPCVQELSRLMRRIVLQRYPRVQAAGLTGDDWLQFLDHTGTTNQFTHGAGRALAQGPYALNSDADISKLAPLIAQWIKKNL